MSCSHLIIARDKVFNGTSKDSYGRSNGYGLGTVRVDRMVKGWADHREVNSFGSSRF